MSGDTFKTIMGRLEPVDWKATPASEPPRGLVVHPHAILCGDRPVGLLDGVAAAHFLQGQGAHRILVGVNDYLVNLHQALKVNDGPEIMRSLLELPEVLTLIGQHHDRSFERVQGAMQAHDLLMAEESRGGGKPH